MLLSIAVGRSGYWSQGLEIHYGYLAVMLPIASWLVISMDAKPKLASLIALVLLTFYGTMYLSNAEHATSVIPIRNLTYFEMYGDLAAETDVKEFARKQIKNLFFEDSEHARQVVADNLCVLKSARHRHFAFSCP